MAKVNVYLSEKHQTICILVRWIVVREKLSDIPESCCAEDRVGYGVKKNVGIRMAQKPFRVLDLNPAKYETSAFNEAVDVITVTYTHLSPPHQVPASVPHRKDRDRTFLSGGYPQP